MKKVFALAILSILLIIHVVDSQDEDWKEKLGEDLKQTIEENQKPLVFKILSSKEEPINVIVITSNKEELKKHIDAEKELSLIQGVSTELTRTAVEVIAKLPSTEKILIDHPVKSFRLESIPLIRADTAASNFLVNGTNIIISIVDSGITNVSEFQSPNRITKQKCFINHGGTRCPSDNSAESNNATDDDGHGTHVAGIAAGKGGGTSGTGVATNSTLFAVKVLNVSGSGLSSDIIKGIEWSIDNGANIISLSLGLSYSAFTNCYDVSTSLAVENATSLGVLVVVAAGNDGSGSSTTAAPACAKSAITAGSVNDSSNSAPVFDNISSFSSRGPTNDNRTKPDLVAPGEWIRSTFNTTHSATIAGTSQAAPHVTGVAALLMQKYNSTYGYIPNPSLVKTILLTAVNTTGMQTDGHTQRNNVYGAGRIDAYEAIRIMNFTKNSTIIQNETKVFYINVTNSSAKVTVYWPENSTVSNNLDLIVGNSTLNYSYPTDSRDNVEQVFIYNSTNGTWRVYVNGTTISGSQTFYLASNREFIDFITIESPLNQTYGTGSLHFNMTVTKAIANATVSIDNGANHTLTNDTLFHYYNLTIPALLEGTRNATFYANDSNNFITNTTYFTIDLTKPLILIQSPENGTYNDTNVSLNFTLSETGSWCGYSLDNSANTTLTDCSNSTLSSLSEGSHNVTIYANDTAGNMNKSNAGIFSVSLPLTYSSNGTNVSSNIVGKFGSITLFANWTDLEGLGYAWLWTNETGGTGRNYTDGTYRSPLDINSTSSQTWSNFTWRNTSINAGDVIAWRIYANDTTSKENSTVQSIFTIDNSPPTFNNTKNTSALYNDSVQINISWYDNSVHTVLFESNFSNILTNYTATRSGNEYYFTVNPGNQTVDRFVVYRWYANDTSGLYNSTVQSNYTVSKAPTLTRLFLNGTEGNRIYAKGHIANISATINITGKNVTIVANFTNTTVTLANGTAPQQNITNTSNLNISVYNITAYFLGDENHTASSVSYNMSVLKVDSDSCSIASECFGGFCNSGVCASSAPPAQSSSSLSNGGGGGGGVVPTQSAKVTFLSESQAKITIPSIPANTVQDIQINETYIIQKISLKSTAPLKNVEIKIERVPLPVDVPYPSGSVFEYLKVDEVNITSNQTSTANITFKVSKTWISENSINSSTIALTRYTTQWDKLTTIKVNETVSDLIYTAISPGLSVFAITGEPIKLKTPKAQETQQPVPETPQPQEKPKSKTGILILLIIITVLAFSVVIFILFRNYEDWKKLYKKYSR